MVANSSLVFRLWITLSLLATAFSALALGTYTLLAVADSIDAAHKQTQAKVRVIQSSLSRLTQPGNEPGAADIQLAKELGVRSLRFVGPAGRDLGGSQFGALPTQNAEQEAAFVASATVDRPVQRRVRIDNGSFAASATTPLDVIGGGTFGEEYVLAVNVPQVPGGPVKMVFVVQYPDVSGEASTIIERSLWVGVVIISATVIGMWLLLRLFVTRPLRRLSQLALRIAGGDRVRMPAKGGDELSELGHALNGMADALQHQATVDSLTGLYNLRHLSSNLESLINEAAEERKPLSVIVGDLDNLKPVNDTFGHLAGDKLLQAVSETLRSWGGHGFTCWRLGGDEFAVALPRVNQEAALNHASELRRRIAAIQLSGQGGIRASISVGVACYPEDGENAGALLAAADCRMYALKALRAEERRLAAEELEEPAKTAA